MNVDMPDGPAGELAVAVAGGQTVEGQPVLFAHPTECGPEVGLSRRRQVQHVGDVFIRDEQEMQACPTVRKLIRTDRPMCCAMDDAFAFVLRQMLGAEQADSSRLE